MAKRAVLSLLLTLSLTNLAFATTSSSILPSTLEPTNKLEPDKAIYPDEKSDDLKTERSKSDLQTSSAPSSSSMLKSLTVADPKKLSLLEKAYLDVFTILNDENSCSRLYGGSPAIAALNELVQKLHPTYLDRNIAIRMKGNSTIFQSYRNKFTFRLFDTVEVNLEGAFYRSSAPGERRIPLVANYQPNTRESRVVVLLHELGHMVRGKNKAWLLPDDGGDHLRSQKNSEFVVQACRDQIDAISKMTPAQQLAKSASPRETIASRGESEGTPQF
jgi:hypothetical protein